MTDQPESFAPESGSSVTLPGGIEIRPSRTSQGVAIYYGGERIINFDEDALDEFSLKLGSSLDEFVEIISKMDSGNSYEGPKFDSNGNGYIETTVQHRGDDPAFGDFEDALDVRDSFFKNVYEPRAAQLKQIKEAGHQTVARADAARDRYIDADDNANAKLKGIMDEFD
ncbi:hypothetical protein [Haloglycomyces albus]|uniref:hypothetical protein n=1 Tax=Haloglycomyces albus TaxID=526067 RepID=UPI00046CC8C7|nr:hypothetical protein [Haloglycomyces albus]